MLGYGTAVQPGACYKSDGGPSRAAVISGGDMEKSENRCWPGYEPVKGKKEHEEGSCRPKAEGKLTPTEKKFRAKRKKQLDTWEKEHPGSARKAAQHLHDRQKS